MKDHWIVYRQHLYMSTFHVGYINAELVVVYYYQMSGTLSYWDLPVQKLCLPPPSAQSPSSSLCQYCHDIHPTVASTE